MSKYVKNTHATDTQNWTGQDVDAGEYFEIEDHKIARWQNNSQFLIDLANGLAVMAKSDSGTADITDIVAANNFLMDNAVNEVIIQEEDTKTGGHFQESSYSITVGSGDSTKELDVSFPFPISLLAASWQNKSDFDTDSIEFEVGPGTTIGTITSNVASTDTEISVSQTVIDNTSIGYYIKLYDGTNTDDLGRVLSIDKVNNKITMETAATQAFTASTPTYIKQTVKMLPKSPLDTEGSMSAGESKIGGSYIPANTILRATYHNTAATAKKFIFFMEYLY